ncbi:MAG: surface lipoprotein assembly modifier [Formosimonas sp.]
MSQPLNAQATPQPDWLDEQWRAQPEQLRQTLNDLVDLGQWPHVERLMRLYAQLPEHDALLVEFAHAGLERYHGQYENSIRRYQRLAQQYPELARVRLELAATLAENNQDVSAIEQFERVQQDNPPPNVKQNISAFVQQMNQKYKPQLNVSVSGVWDSNINHASTDKYVVLGPFVLERTPESLPQKGYGLHYKVDVSQKFRIADQQSLSVGARVFGKTYPSWHESDDQSAQLNIGYHWQSAVHALALLPTYQKRWLANQAYSKALGLRAEWRYMISPNWQSAVTYEYNRLRHTQTRYFDGHNSFASLMLSYKINDKSVLFGGLDALFDLTEEKSASSLRVGYRAGLVQHLPWHFTARLDVSYANRLFKDAPSLFNTRRHDQEVGYGLTLWNDKVDFLGLSPKLSFEHNRVKSNLSLYKYSKNQINLTLNKTF